MRRSAEGGKLRTMLVFRSEMNVGPEIRAEAEEAKLSKAECVVLASSTPGNSEQE